jgi:hypothetical protein
MGKEQNEHLAKHHQDVTSGCLHQGFSARGWRVLARRISAWEDKDVRLMKRLDGRVVA